MLIWQNRENNALKIMSDMSEHQHTKAVSAGGGGAADVTKRDSQ